MFAATTLFQTLTGGQHENHHTDRFHRFVPGLNASCQNGAPNSARTTPENLRLAFGTNNSSDFWTIARRGTEKADAELADVSVDFRIPSEGTAADQKRLLDDLMSAGVQGIAVSPSIRRIKQTRLTKPQNACCLY